MPPSGYSTRSADGLIVFLREAMVDLRTEIDNGKHASLEAGLSYEVGQITRALCSPSCGDQERALLTLTKRFYEEALVGGEEAALKNARERVLSIHINDKGEPVRNNSVDRG